MPGVPLGGSAGYAGSPLVKLTCLHNDPWLRRLARGTPLSRLKQMILLVSFGIRRISSKASCVQSIYIHISDHL